MGYSTQFTGVLKFAAEPTREQLAELKKWLGVDVREKGFKGFGKDGFGCHLDLELTDDFGGVQWDGSEKTYYLDAAVNFVTDRMREKWPGFAFTGTLAAQGEDTDDRWKLVMKDGRATRVDDPPTGRKVTCPECGKAFYLD
jgi:hypothetical protein